MMLESILTLLSTLVGGGVLGMLFKITTKKLQIFSMKTRN